MQKYYQNMSIPGSNTFLEYLFTLPYMIDGLCTRRVEIYLSILIGFVRYWENVCLRSSEGKVRIKFDERDGFVLILYFFHQYPNKL